MEFNEVEFAKKNYRFTIVATLAVVVVAFIFTFITINLHFAFIVAGCVLFFGIVFFHPRVIEEIQKSTAPMPEDMKKRFKDDHERRTSSAYLHLPGNSAHGAYMNNYYPFK